MEHSQRQGEGEREGEEEGVEGLRVAQVATVLSNLSTSDSAVETLARHSGVLRLYFSVCLNLTTAHRRNPSFNKVQWIFGPSASLYKHVEEHNSILRLSTACMYVCTFSPFVSLSIVVLSI